MLGTETSDWRSVNLQITYVFQIKIQLSNGNTEDKVRQSLTNYTYEEQSLSTTLK